MAELRWIQTCFSLLLLLQVTVVTGQDSFSSSIAVRAGDDVTLSCTYVIDGQHECDRTDWIFSVSGYIELVRRGKIVEDNNFLSDRLRVTEDCSLVLMKVSAGDVGRFECRQISSGQIFHYTRVDLSVVTMTEDDDGDEVTLTCSVSAHRNVIHTVKWLYEGGAVGGGNTNMKTSESTNSATVTFPSSDLRTTKNLESFQCQVSDRLNPKGQLFTFTAPTSDDDDTTTTATTTTKGKTALPTPYMAAVAGGLAALLIAAVVFFMWRRRKGRRTQIDQDAEKPQQPDPDDGISYASINYIKQNKEAGAQAPVRGGDGGDEGDTVTYSTVKVSSSSSSTHPSDIYANVNKPQR